MSPAVSTIYLSVDLTGVDECGVLVELLPGPEPLLAGQRPEELDTAPPGPGPGVELVVPGDQDRETPVVVPGGVAGRAVYQTVVVT